MARRGFTLSEVMVALFVSGIVLTAVMSSFLPARRMMAEVMAESETALADLERRVANVDYPPQPEPKAEPTPTPAPGKPQIGEPVGPGDGTPEQAPDGDGK